MFVEVTGEKLVGLKHLLLFELWAREICENFVYKNLETIEYVKN